MEPFSVAFSEELSIEKAKTAKAVWKIELGDGRKGTGFFISENQIVTNAHVVCDVKDIEDITIIQEENLRQLKANKIVSLSIRHDLAILEVDGFVSDFLSLPKDSINPSNIYVLGYPRGKFQEIRQTGVLKEDYFFSDNSYLAGARGGPVLNEVYQLVGILNQASYNMDFFIEILKSFIKDEYFLCEVIFKNVLDHQERVLKKI